MKKIALIMAVTTVFAMVIGCGPSREELCDSARDSSVITSEYKPQIEYYCRWVNKINSRADRNWNKLVQALEGLEARTVSVRDVHKIANDAHYESGRAKDRYLELDSKLPEGLSDELNALCCQINEYYFGAYNNREDAAQSLIAYLETRQPEDKRDFLDSMKDVTFFMASARQDLAAARRKVGLN